MIYGALIAYFGHQAVRAYQARQAALDRASQQDPSIPVPGVKRTATLPNGETIEYMEYELTPEQAAAMDMKVPPAEDGSPNSNAPAVAPPKPNENP